MVKEDFKEEAFRKVTPILIVAILILAVGALSGATMSAFRKEKRSIESHKRLLGLMEEISAPIQSAEGQLSDSEREKAPTHVRTIRPGRPNAFQPETMPTPQVEQPTEREPSVLGQRESLLESRVVSNTPTAKTPEAVVGPDDATIQMKRVVFDDVSAPVAPVTAAERPRPKHASSGAQLRVASLIALLVVGVGAVTAAVFEATKAHPNSVGTTPTTTKSKKSPVTTTTAAPVQLTAVSSNSSGATYVLPSGSASVVLHASAPCWVEQSTTPYGTVSWDATLAANQSYTISASGSLWLRTGNVGVLSITVNGRPVIISAGPGPYNFTFSTTA